MKLFHTRSFVFTIIILSLTACADSGSDADPAFTSLELSGQIQKGPFIVGTEVTIQELNDDLSPTSRSFQTETTDNLGSYLLPISLTNTLVEISANGYYFNEVTGELSSATLRLSTLADTSENTEININILTHLAKKRILTLVAIGSTFSEAKQQAEAEVSSLFMFNDSNTALSSFDQMDISQTGGSNSFLLLVSSIFQTAYETSANLSEYVEILSQDLSNNGTVDNDELTDIINAAELIVDLDVVRENLEEKYMALGQSVVISDFESLIDRIPTASIAVNQSGQIGTPVTLSGIGIDADHDDLLYSWVLTSSPEESTAVISNADTVTPYFTPDVHGTYSFSFTVSDGRNNSAPETASISTVNRPPKANAGEDINLEIDDFVTLDGSESYDDDSDELTFLWTSDQFPETSTNAVWTIDNLPKTDPSMTAITFTLKVTDAQGFSDEDQVIINLPVFTKISSAGEDLPGSASEWSCVRDNITGHFWEVKTSEGTGLHDINNTYRWGGIGAEQSGTEFYDDWNVFVSGSQGLCGFNDWHVPSKDVIILASQTGTRALSLMSQYFPYYSSIFWSSSAYDNNDVNDSLYAWAVYIDNGGSGRTSRYRNVPVRLVRGGQ